MTKILSILFTIQLFFFASCKSNSRAESGLKTPTDLGDSEVRKTDLIDEPQPEVVVPMPLQPTVEVVEKKIDPQVCTMEFNPSRCYYRNYKINKILEFDRVYGWGNNPCAAKSNLNFNIEQKGLKEDNFSDLICVPDAAVGLCSQIKTDCGDKEILEHVSCHLKTYKNKKFMPHDIIYVSAKSRCLARVKVEQELCRRNLYSQPVLDTQLSCEEFDEALDCESAEPTTCSDYYRPAVCAFNIAELSKEENAIFDRNDCLARETLKHKLCLRGFDKSFVESAHLVCE